MILLQKLKNWRISLSKNKGIKMKQEYEKSVISYPMSFYNDDKAFSLLMKLTKGEPAFFRQRHQKEGWYYFFDSVIHWRTVPFAPIGPDEYRVETHIYRSKTKKPIAFDFCQLEQDVIDFLTIAKALGHPVEIFSNSKPQKDHLQNIILQNRKLPGDYKWFLRYFSEECKTATDLVSKVVVSKKKKSAPGQAVYEETKSKGLHVYIDDEKEVIEDIVNVFGQSDASLPVLCKIERSGIKNPEYRIPESHKGIDNIVVVKSLMDKNLLKAIYCNEKKIYKSKR